MKTQIYNKIFDFDITKTKNIYISKNEIYNQLLLYIYFNTDQNLLLVFSTLNEATEVYRALKNYIDEVYIFPEDDFITKTAVATSPELLFLRLNLLYNIKKNTKKIVIVHYNSFIKKLPNKNEYNNQKLELSIGKEIKREKLINNLLDLGYKKESLVTNTSEFSVRGYVIDVFPIHEEKPFRIEFFDDEITKIINFDTLTQLSSKYKETKNLAIYSVKESFGEENSNIIEYLNNPIIIYTNYNEILKVEKALIPQINYLNIKNKLFDLKKLKTKNDIYINTVDNEGKYDLKIEAITIENHLDNKKTFYDSVMKNNGIVFSLNDKVINECSKNNITVYKQYLHSSFKYKNVSYYSSNEIVNLNKQNKQTSLYKYGSKINELDKIKKGDYVVHKKSGIGIYGGIKTILKNGLKKDYVLILYKGKDKLYVPVEDISKLYKYSGKEGAKPTIHRLNSVEWVKTKLKIKKRIRDITNELIKIYKERSKAKIKPFSKDDASQLLFEHEFEYEETLDQLKATIEIKKDLEKNIPMERLLCGDVGYGKTEVIFRAIYKTVMNNYQVAYLCPTTILSFQQYNNAIERFKNYGVNIDIINRHFTEKQVKEKIENLKEGKTDVIFGTHRLLSKDIIFNRLGLLIIDEEHRFGVEQKEKIKSLKSNVHVLSVSATPIPRSLQMSLVGIRDMSLLDTAPKNRYPVQTYVIEYNEMLVREAILKEMSRKGQTFILYNRIINMEFTFEKIKKLVPEARICYAHGQMNKEKLQDVIIDFNNYVYDVLVSTTIIENGIDIPNANTIIIMDSDQLGLAQLYQLRGRVGRSDKIAYAYLTYKKQKILTTTAKQRLDAIKEFTELGSGYRISMRDLAIRGAGDILGSEQAGFIDSVGVDMYMDLINEEINGIEDNIEEEILPIDVQTHIDESYTNDNSIIIELHKKINNIKKKKDFEEVYNEIKDRFGKVDENLKIYMYEKYYEQLIQLLKIQLFENDDLKITFKLKKEFFKNINIDYLFFETQKISEKFNFKCKNNIIYITLLKGTLDKHYIYYCVLLLELIMKIKNKGDKNV